MKKQRSPLAQALREARFRAELTLREVAKASGASTARLCQLENGAHANPSLKTIRALTRLYKLDPTVWFRS
jgi:transcriptional regulator with XRE-family HTH domain